LLLCQVDQVEQALEFVQEWFARLERAARRERKVSQPRASTAVSLAPMRGAALRP
jgi:hypothetical protein